MILTSPYRPPAWLRNPHLQSALSSGPLRRWHGQRRLAAAGAEHREHLLELPGGVRLHGVHSRRPEPPHGLVLLLHGWEGSVESSYLLHAAAELLEAGFAVFRLHFRDHGGTHHLNPGMFHSCRLEEVVQAALWVAERHPDLPLSVAGFSLGGNFALRLAREAPAHGLPLVHAAAVCPVLDPAAGMDALEQAPGLYAWYFLRKWRVSLRRKRALFPEHCAVDPRVLGLGLRELTRWLVERHTDFGSLERYFDGYRIAGDRLAAVQVPLSVLTAADDPVIPIESFRQWRLPPKAWLEIADHGGHCAFLEDAGRRGYAERWLRLRLSLSRATQAAAVTMADPQLA